MKEDSHESTEKNIKVDPTFEKLLDLIPDMVCIASVDGYFKTVNLAWEKSLGYAKEELLGLPFIDFVHPEDIEGTIQEFSKEISGKPTYGFVNRYRKKDGSYKWLEWTNTKSIDSGLIYAVARDVTEHKTSEKIALLLAKALGHLNKNETLGNLIHDVLLIIKEFSCCEAVGIRLHEGEDYPYYQTHGFPDEHLVLENNLCQIDAEGKILRDVRGNPVLECMCGNIIQGRFDPQKPFFTPGGSFWTNSMTDLMATSTGDDRQARARDRFNGEVYESIALIPLRLPGGEIIGLLQLNDTHRNRFTPELIFCLENITENIAIVVDKKKSEYTLKESEQFNKSLLENSPIPIIVHNRDASIEYVNPAWEKITGYSFAEVMKKGPPFPYWPEEKHSVYLKYWQEHVDSDRIQTGVILFKNKSGEYFWVEITGSAVKDTEGKVKYRISSWLDVTTRLKTEMALKESEHMYRTLFEEMLSGFALHDIVYDENGVPVDYITLEVNREYERLLNTSKETVAGKRGYQSFPDLDKEWLDIFGDVALTGKPRRYVQYASNLAKWFEGVAFSPQKGRFAVTFIDITERKQMEEALRESEEFRNTILENSSYPLVVRDSKELVVYVNPAFEQLTGFSSSEVIGTALPAPWWLGKETWKIYTEHLINSLHSRKTIEAPLKKKAGEVIWAEVTSGPVMKDGHLKYRVSNWVDITERKKMEQELLHSREQLRQFSLHLQEVLESEKKRLSGEIHDELGQILTGIKIDISLLAKGLPPGSEDLVRKSKSALALIEQADKVVKRIAGDLRPVSLDDLGLVETVKWLVNQFKTRTGIKCELDAPDSLNTDKERALDIFRIIQESLTNISRHARATRVRVDLKLNREVLVLNIQDNGRGVKTEELTASNSFGLMGMQERARRWQGSLEIKGAPGKGTKIIMKMPLNGGKHD